MIRLGSCAIRRSFTTHGACSQLFYQLESHKVVGARVDSGEHRLMVCDRGVNHQSLNYQYCRVQTIH